MKFINFYSNEESMSITSKQLAFLMSREKAIGKEIYVSMINDNYNDSRQNQLMVIEPIKEFSDVNGEKYKFESWALSAIDPNPSTPSLLPCYGNRIGMYKTLREALGEAEILHGAENDAELKGRQIALDKMQNKNHNKTK